MVDVKYLRGFTLLESLIALAVMALLVSVAWSISMNALRDSRFLWREFMAAQIAENAANALLLKHSFPDLRPVWAENVSMGGYDFVVQAEVRATPSRFVRELIITVRDDKPSTPPQVEVHYSAFAVGMPQ